MWKINLKQIIKFIIVGILLLLVLILVHDSYENLKQDYCTYNCRNFLLFRSLLLFQPHYDNRKAKN
jgi:hypothetical protein